MAFLLRFAAPALESVGLGSIGKIATTITNPLTHAIGGMFNFGKNAIGSVFGSIGGAARTIGGAVMTPFKILQSPIVWLGGGALIIYLITNR